MWAGGELPTESGFLNPLTYFSRCILVRKSLKIDFERRKVKKLFRVNIWKTRKIKFMRKKVIGHFSCNIKKKLFFIVLIWAIITLSYKKKKKCV